MSRKFLLVEAAGHFGLTHIASRQYHVVGDGVDEQFGTPVKPITVGMPGFRQAWEDAFHLDVDQTMEAYFPDVLKRENDRDDIEKKFIALIRKAEGLGIMVEAIHYKNNDPFECVVVTSENLEGKEVAKPGNQPEPTIIFNVDWDNELEARVE